MSFIQFESARDKEKVRQELRDARDEMLQTAKLKAEERAQREIRKKLSGENDWMHPAVSAKIEKLSKSTTSKKKDKKSLKKAKKKKRHQSSSSSANDSSAEDDYNSQKKSKKVKKRTHQRKHSANSPNSKEQHTSDEWIERATICVAATKPEEIPMKRDSWMTNDALLLKTFSREKVEKKVNEKHQIDAYDPAKSGRELNPYWKTTGTGLPAFQKPNFDSDDGADSRHRQGSTNATNARRNWQKQTTNVKTAHNQKNDELIRPAASSSSSDVDDNNVAPVPKQSNESSMHSFLNDQQLNELGAKIIKAEIMGNQELAEQLKKKLENARASRATIQERGSGVKNATSSKRNAPDAEKQHILLTHTDEKGNSRPLLQSTPSTDPRNLYESSSKHKRQSRKRVETHMAGDRVRYFADDDKYDIKQMFEREKYSTAADSNLQFADIVAKHKNPNDDLEDIFADKIRKNISETDTAKREYQRAIHENQRLGTQLDNCERCLDSEKMDKRLLVAMGEKVYLALPSQVALQTGQCVIVTTQHVSCCTQLDEDAWLEVNDFRKALTRMFAAQRKDVIFFEIANKLQRRPHLSIHCVPIAERAAELAPFYFKKAIEESEHEWSVNKQLVSLRAGKGLRNSIPKGLPYFWVNFGMDNGFAHVIEDQSRFPSNFAQEIIGGMLHMDASEWRKPRKESNIVSKVKNFVDMWKKYDCTEP